MLPCVNAALCTALDLVECIAARECILYRLVACLISTRLSLSVADINYCGVVAHASSLLVLAGAASTAARQSSNTRNQVAHAWAISSRRQLTPALAGLFYGLIL
jgi:hypothetical protein